MSSEGHPEVHGDFRPWRSEPHLYAYDHVDGHERADDGSRHADPDELVDVSQGVDERAMVALPGGR